MRLLSIFLIVLTFIISSCSDHVAKGLATRGVSRYANKEFKKITDIDKKIVLESPHNLLLFMTFKGNDKEEKYKEASWCVCIRKKMGMRTMLMTRINTCTPDSIDQYKDTCKYPNDVDKKLAKELGIPLGKDLFELALKGDIDEFTRAFKDGDVNVNRRFSVGNFSLYTAVHGAVFNNHTDILNYLVQRKANLNSLDHYNNTPIHYSDISLDALKLLAEKGAKLDSRNNRGETPIFNYIREGRKELINFIMEKGAKLNINNEFNENPINILVNSFLDAKWDKGDFKAMLIKLNKAGVGLDNKSKIAFENRDYPVVLFTQSLDMEILKELAKLKANFNVRSNNNLTPLMIALEKKDKALVKFLVENGADPNLGDGEEQNPLSMAIPDFELTKYLLDKGFQLNYANIHSLIRVAEDSGSDKIINLLKERGKKVLDEESEAEPKTEEEKKKEAEKKKRLEEEAKKKAELAKKAALKKKKSKKKSKKYYKKKKYSKKSKYYKKKKRSYRKKKKTQ